MHSDAEDDRWTVDVTDADVRMARLAWQAARDSGADDARTALLRTDLERLWNTQARQVAARFRRERTGAPGLSGS